MAPVAVWEFVSKTHSVQRAYIFTYNNNNIIVFCRVMRRATLLASVNHSCACLAQQQQNPQQQIQEVSVNILNVDSTLERTLCAVPNIYDNEIKVFKIVVLDGKTMSSEKLYSRKILLPGSQVGCAQLSSDQISCSTSLLLHYNYSSQALRDTV